MKKAQRRTVVKKKKSKVISYRLKGAKTSNGLSHYIPSEKKTLV